MISPQMHQVLEQYAERRRLAAGQPPPDVESLRARFSPAPRRLPVAPDVTVERTRLGDLPAVWFTPAQRRTDGVILYLHGGGYVAGGADTHGELAGRLARGSGARVLLPEYRRPPEHPFPAAHQDGLRGFSALRDSGLQAAEIVLAGDSAGGGLAMAVMQSLRDQSEALPAAAVLMSPWTDLTLARLDGLTPAQAERDPVLTPEVMHFFASAYLADADARDPRASPLLGTFDGLPPILIQVGTAELLLGDSDGLAAAIRAAGGEVTLERAQGLPHVYPAMAGTPEADAALAESTAFVTRFLAGSARRRGT